MPPERILFSGVGKTAEEMAEALAGGLLQFNLESVEEAQMLSAVAAAAGRSRAGRVPDQPDVEAGTHAKITTGTADNKFGIPAAAAIDAFRAAAACPASSVQGITVHIGSQLTNLDPLEAAFVRLGELIAELRAEASPSISPTSAAGLASPMGPASRTRRARPTMARWSSG